MPVNTTIAFVPFYGTSLSLEVPPCTLKYFPAAYFMLWNTPPKVSAACFRQTALNFWIGRQAALLATA